VNMNLEQLLIPNSTIVDKASGKEYTKGKYLGKGAYSRVYELKEHQTNKV